MSIAHFGFNAETLAQVDSGAYPDLFRPADWGIVSVRFELREDLPPDELVANVNVAPRWGNRWIIAQVDGKAWTIPGGTREPGESLLETLRRESLEEAGAEFSAVRFFGAWRCESSQGEPYRPHLPHPVFYRVVGVGEAIRLGSPQVPPDGETVHEVAVLSLEEAVARLRSSGRNDLADLYRLAACLADGTSPSPRPSPARGEGECDPSHGDETASQ